MFPATLRHVLVLSDFSEPSDQALEAAIELARSTGALLTLLHAFLPPYPLANTINGVSHLVTAIGRVAREQLAARATRAEKQGVKCEVFAQLGTPHVEILHFIEQKSPDLVVMSTHGRTGPGQTALGSVTEHVVQRSRCPVLVLPALQQLAAPAAVSA